MKSNFWFGLGAALFGAAIAVALIPNTGQQPGQPADVHIQIQSERIVVDRGSVVYRFIDPKYNSVCWMSPVYGGYSISCTLAAQAQN